MNFPEPQDRSRLANIKFLSKKKPTQLDVFSQLESDIIHDIVHDIVPLSESDGVDLTVSKSVKSSVMKSRCSTTKKKVVELNRCQINQNPIMVSPNVSAPVFIIPVQPQQTTTPMFQCQPSLYQFPSSSFQYQSFITPPQILHQPPLTIQNSK